MVIDCNLERACPFSKCYAFPVYMETEIFHTLDCIFPKNIVLSPEPLNPPVSVNNNTRTEAFPLGI